MFLNELPAAKAVLRHTLAYFYGHLVSSREIVGGSIKRARRAKAEGPFSKGEIEAQQKGASV